jgi:NitT/TauT family transport system permease protein
VGDSSPIFLIFLASFFPMVVETTTGVHTIERQYLWAVQNFGPAVSSSGVWSSFLPPSPKLSLGCGSALGVAWLVVVATAMMYLLMTVTHTPLVGTVVVKGQL